MPDLLLEIATEEIPPSYIPPALRALADNLDRLLTDSRIAYDGRADIRTLATPRRLVLHVTGLADKQEAITQQISGPAKEVAYDDAGKPTKALIGFCRSRGVDVDAVKVVETKKGPYCVAEKTDAARSTAEVLADGLPATITALPWPKSMYWTDKSLTFARPIRGLIAMLGKKFVPFTIGGVHSGQETHGHPFLRPGGIELHDASLEDYTKRLEKAFVVVDHNRRRARLREQIEAILKKYHSCDIDAELLEQVAFQVEWPGVVEGSFDKTFLDLPDEVLIESMRYHQQYFPVREADTKLTHKFIAVHNRTEAQADTIRAGCERVLTARLNDARFFWDHDRKIPLEAHAERLAGVEYLPKIGSMKDKSERLGILCKSFAPQIPAAGYKGDAENNSLLAGALCKADLVTEMVGEFPRLQGTMGAFYALEQKKNPEIALAIAEHYLPRGADDPLPKTKLGVALALADKLDHLAACFALGIKPSGSSDPLALRRQALGIIRIFTKQRLSVGLGQWVDEALTLVREKVSFDHDAVRAEMLGFLLDRFEDQYIRDGGRKEIFEACRFNGSDNPTDLLERMKALANVTDQPYWPSLQELVERTYNIAKPDPGESEAWVEEPLIELDEERAVWKAYEECKTAVRELFDKKDYLEASAAFERALAEPVHWFFENVFVNVDDERVRTNRLNLLKNICLLFANPFANLAAIHVPEEVKPNRGKR